MRGSQRIIDFTYDIGAIISGFQETREITIFKEKVNEYINRYLPKNYIIIVCGHSLYGAIIDKIISKTSYNNNVKFITFNQYVGNDIFYNFVKLFKSSSAPENDKVYRLHINGDLLSISTNYNYNKVLDEYMAHSMKQFEYIFDNYI